MLNVYDLKIAHPELFKQISVNDNLFVYYRCPQSDHIVNLYNHYEEVLFTLSGRKKFHIGNKSWDLTDEESLLIRKTAYVQEMFDGVDWELLAFHFNADFIKSVLKDFHEQFKIDHIPKLPRDMILKITINPVIRSNFYGMIPLFDDNIKYQKDLVERQVRELLISIILEPRNRDVLAYFNHIYNNHKIPIWHVMESNFMFNLPLSEFSKLTQRSLTTFKNDFKAHYNTTPGKWLHEKRLDFAEHLLKTSSNKNVKEVMYQSGFENLSHFSTAFKNRFGISPSSYKKG